VIELVDVPPALAAVLPARLAALVDAETRRREGLHPLAIRVIGPDAPLPEPAVDAPTPRPIQVVFAHDRARRVAALRLGVEVVIALPPPSPQADAAALVEALDELEVLLARHLEARRRAELAAADQRDLAALLELSRALNDRADVDRVLVHITNMVAELMRGERCSVVLLDDDGREGYVVAASDDPSLHGHRITVDAYPEIAEVMRTRAPLFVEDVARAALFEPVRAQLQGKPVGHAILFPMLLGENIAGVIHVRGAAPRQSILSPRQLQLGELVANVAAIVLRNARLYQTVRERAERVLTARARAERRIRQLESYQRFFDLAGDGLVIVDVHGRFLFANREALRIFGFDPRDLRRLGLLDVASEAGEPAARALVDGVRAGLNGVRVEVEVVRATGDVAILAVATALLGAPEAGEPADAPRDPHTAILSLRDVTRSRTVERALATAQERLELTERQAALVELAGGVAHELNQPLTSILGSAELMERLLEPEHRARGQLERVLREGDRLAEMVRRLGRITEYRTKPYVGATQILDLGGSGS
jgi:PAS domain S-box-containing protein